MGARGVTVGSLSQLEQPVRWNLRGTSQAERRGNNWALRTGPQWQLSSSYASRPKREHPLLLGHLRERQDDWTVKWARGMRVVSAPKDVSLKTPFADFQLKVTRSADELRVVTVLRWKKARISVAEYQDFRRFCRAVDQASASDLLIGP